MLTLFPGLLFLAPLATTILRVTAGLVMLYVAYYSAMEREKIARERFPLIGHMPAWLLLFGILVATVAGVLLIVGLWTQAATIVGIILGLKHLIYARRYSGIMPLSTIAGILLFVICLSLLFSGAGAVAVDLPL